MANDISGINSSRAQQTGERSVTSSKKESSDSTKGTSSRSSAGSDKVSLTNTAERLKALEHQLASQPEVDKGRVSSVQNAISNGEYKVDPERVANKMIDFESSFDTLD